MMTGIVSVNIKKIKATAKVNRLLDENYRDEKTAEKYDDGHRVIRTAETGENVFLLARPENYDRTRKDRIERINERRARRANTVRVSGERERLREAGTLQAKKSREAAMTRKLRSDTVDTLGIVVQPSADFINGLSRDEQIRFFRDSLNVLQAHPEEFGKVETAVIHFDENTPHMQCLASTLNEETLTADAKRIVGGKTQLSNKQTILADELRAKGWDVDRGMKRVNNSEYQNWKTDMEMQGFRVNRFNDRILQEQTRAIKEQSLQNRIDAVDNLTRSVELDEKARTLETARREHKRTMQAEEQRLTEVRKARDAEEKRLERLRSESKSVHERAKNAFQTAYTAQIAAFRNERAELTVQRQKWQIDRNTLQEAKDKLEEDQEQLKKDREQLEKDKEAFAEQKKTAFDNLKQMTKTVGTVTANELEYRQSALQEARQMNDFNDFAKAIEDIGNHSENLPFSR